MHYRGLFKSKYKVLAGKDWIRGIDKEDLSVFIDIGLQHADRGRMGGNKLFEKYGREHMKQMGKVGALVVNLRKYFQRAIEEENERLSQGDYNE